MLKKCDGIFEGGGVKGIGFAGALAAIEQDGYEFENVIGTSAGAIVASLIAAGYTSDEILHELTVVNFNDFKQEGMLSQFGGIGKMLNTCKNFGIYKTDYFETWLEELLKRKNKTFFKDIRTDSVDPRYKYKFQAVASDLTDNKMLILPRDLEDIGINADEFKISTAVRMSMSIPFYFEPHMLWDDFGRKHLIVDGGLLSNYPISIMDDGTQRPPWPTFGFRFSECDNVCLTNPIDNIVDFGKSIVTTVLDAHDKYYETEIIKGDKERTIFINTTISVNEKKRKIKTTDFNINKEELYALYENGKTAGKAFLSSWNFDKWVKKYRCYTHDR